MDWLKQGIRSSGVGIWWGLAFFTYEELFNRALGQPPLANADLVAVMPMYIAISALFALIVGVFLRGVNLAWGIWSAIAGLLLGGKFAHFLGEMALPKMLGFVISALFIGGFMWFFMRVTRRAPRTRWAGLTGAWVLMVGGLVVNLGATANPMSKEALIWDGVIGLLSLLVSALVLYLYRDIKPVRFAMFAALSGLALLGVAIAYESPETPAISTSSNPPVVLIVIDTLRGDHLGVTGHTGDLTPNIDRIAEQGYIYTNAQSASSWTLPATASLFTGRTPSSHGAGVNHGTGNTNRGLTGQVQTLASSLTEAGYSTGAFVTNAWLKRLFGLDDGFSTYDDSLGLGHEPLLLQPLDHLGLSIMQDRYYTKATHQVDKALGWLDFQGDAGWMLTLHLMDAHGPYNPPERYIQGEPADYEDPLERLYDAEIRYLDNELGRLFDAIPQDAWIFITSDHGEELTEHAGAYSDQPIPDGTRHGHTLYQEVVNVPLIVRPPSGVTSARIPRVVRSFDVAPTIARIGNAELAVDNESFVLSELFGEIPTTSPAFSEALRYGNERKAVRLENDKFISDGAEFELYELSVDPGETLNLSNDQAEKRNELSELLIWDGDSTVVEEVQLDEATQEQLRQLGYLD
jgi:arylsulfatase